MKIVDIKQQTHEWIQWRRTKITASDSSTIMGSCNFKSPKKLYDEKIKGYEQVPNFWMMRGLELEPIALKEFEKETGLILFPCVGQHDSIQWMAASFDGMTIEGDAIVEIKCGGEKSHNLALQGIVDERYYPQIQHQLEVAGIENALYFSFDGSKGKILEVKRDQDFIDEMIEKEFEFWQCLQTLTPPQTTRRRKNASTTTISGTT